MKRLEMALNDLLVSEYDDRLVIDLESLEMCVKDSFRDILGSSSGEGMYNDHNGIYVSSDNVVQWVYVVNVENNIEVIEDDEALSFISIMVTYQLVEKEKELLQETEAKIIGIEIYENDLVEYTRG